MRPPKLQSNFGEKRTRGEGIFLKLLRQFKYNLSRDGRLCAELSAT
jgi:hypothetical protein